MQIIHAGGTQKKVSTEKAKRKQEYMQFITKYKAKIYKVSIFSFSYEEYVAEILDQHTRNTEFIHAYNKKNVRITLFNFIQY